MNKNRPMIKRIKTENGFYLYDGKSNRIFRVTECMFEMIYLIGIINNDEIKRQMKSLFSQMQIEDAIKRLTELINQGFFSLGGVNQRVGKITKMDIEEQLRSGAQLLTLEVTENCNLRCKYCIFSGNYVNMRKFSLHKMSWDIAKLAIDFHFEKNKFAKSISIGFYGGEPLLEFELIKKACDYVYSLEKHRKTKRKINFSLTTNGTLLSEEIIKYLIKNRFCITISLDGPKEFHDKNRVDLNGYGTFEKVVAAIKWIYEKYPKYYKKNILINSVLAPQNNLMKTKEFFNSFPELFWNRMNFSSVDIGNSEYFEENPYYDEFNRDWNQLYEDYYIAHITGKSTERQDFTHKLLENDFLRMYKRRIVNSNLDNLNLINTCIPGNRKLFVDVYGNYHACERVARSFPIGNVNFGYDYDLITSYMNMFCELMNSIECRNCWAVQFCPICITAGQDINYLKQEIHDKCVSCINRFEKVINIYCSILEKRKTAFDYFENYVLS